jgi:hypothetical protein
MAEVSSRMDNAAIPMENWHERMAKVVGGGVFGSGNPYRMVDVSVTTHGGNDHLLPRI